MKLTEQILRVLSPYNGLTLPEIREAVGCQSKSVHGIVQGLVTCSKVRRVRIVKPVRLDKGAGRAPGWLYFYVVPEVPAHKQKPMRGILLVLATVENGARTRQETIDWSGMSASRVEALLGAATDLGLVTRVWSRGDRAWVYAMAERGMAAK